jgi:hypothetical protein
MASSSVWGGMILAVCSWYRRSMISANARMEHKMSGQMGHPAAWMMDNKTVPSGALKVTKACDYGRIVGVSAR